MNVEDKVTAKIIAEDFWNSISDDDKKIILLKQDGLSQKQIAEKVGLKTHGAVSKRLARLKEQFHKIV